MNNRTIVDGHAFQEMDLLDGETGNVKRVVKKMNPNHYDRIAMNETFLSVEIYNKLDEDMFFVSMIEEDKGMPHYKIAIRGKSFGLLPHQNYIGSTKSGRPLEMIKNFGKNKFIGNKHPSSMGLE